MMGWHAGSGTGNRESIGIEICENEDGNRAKAEANAVELIRYLMKELDIPISRVVPHQHWTGKYCPRNILPRWSDFLDRIKAGGLAIDGIFGPKTEARVKAFQKAMGISADGIVGPETRKYLFPAYPGTLLKRGSRGVWVKRVQWQLGGLSVDGIFGPKTEAAVKAFQKKAGIAVDGIVGPVTWGKLF